MRWSVARLMRHLPWSPRTAPFPYVDGAHLRRFPAMIEV